MSNATREINRITTAIIRISMKLIVYALIILLLYEAVIKGYAFGHQIFYAEAMEEAPGHDMTVTIEPDTSVSEAAQMLADDGLINSEFAFIFQSMFYDYDAIYPGVYDLNTSMTSKEILQALNVKPETEETEAAQKAGGSPVENHPGSGGSGERRSGWTGSAGCQGGWRGRIRGGRWRGGKWGRRRCAGCRVRRAGRPARSGRPGGSERGGFRGRSRG